MCAARHQIMWGIDVCNTCECFACECCGCCLLSFLPDAIRGKPNLSREAQQAGAHDCWHATGGVSCLEWGRGGCPVLPVPVQCPAFAAGGHCSLLRAPNAHAGTALPAPRYSARSEAWLACQQGCHRCHTPKQSDQNVRCR